MKNQVILKGRIEYIIKKDKYTLIRLKIKTEGHENSLSVFYYEDISSLSLNKGNVIEISGRISSYINKETKKTRQSIIAEKIINCEDDIMDINYTPYKDFAFITGEVVSNKTISPKMGIIVLKTNPFNTVSIKCYHGEQKDIAIGSTIETKCVLEKLRDTDFSVALKIYKR